MNKSKKRNGCTLFKWILSGAITRIWVKTYCLLCDQLAGKLPNGVDCVKICRECSTSME